MRRYGRDPLHGLFESNFAFYGKLAAQVGAVVALGLGLEAGTAKIADAGYGADKAKSFLEDAGYTHVEHTDTDYMFIQVTGCGRDDNVKYEFDAVGPTGNTTELDVCKGMFKGATIRQG